VVYFEKESKRWPESRPLMEKLIRNAARAKAPAATPAAVPPRPSRGEEMKRLLVLAALAAACAQPPKKDYAKLVSSNPRAILVVPVVNKSVDVDAADYFLSTLSVPSRSAGITSSRSIW